MAKTQSDKPRQDDATSAKPAAAADKKTESFILTGADIVAIGADAEILVGGKNYNTALISQIQGIRAPQFRAVSSTAFHRVLDDTKVNASLIREVVNEGYRSVNWSDEEVNSDPEYMSEIPSNAILAKQYIQEFDGFSIGSNDMTQMVLGTDRDNPALRHIYDEEDPAVVWALLVTIFAGQKYGKKVGFCGQGVSNSIILRGLVAIAGIVCASVVPDTYYRTKFDMAACAAISSSGL